MNQCQSEVSESGRGQQLPRFVQAAFVIGVCIVSWALLIGLFSLVY